MPEGTPLEQTQRVASALAAATLKDPAVVNVQSYAGTSSPYNFNGLVRHYFLRRQPHLADLQVNLTRQGRRAEQSHDIAKRVRATPAAASRSSTAPPSRWPRCRPARRCCRRWWPRSTAPTRRGGVELAQTGARHLRADARRRRRRLVRRGRRSRAWTSSSTTRRRRPPGCRPRRWRPWCRWRARARSPGLLHDASAREDVPIVLRLPRERLGGLNDLREPSASPAAPGRRGRADPAGRRGGGPEHLPQEPAAGHLRHRRHGRRRPRAPSTPSST